MVYEVPAHTICAKEAELMNNANLEADTLIGIWMREGARGFARETGCKLVGIWPERMDKQGTPNGLPKRTDAAGSGSGIETYSLAKGATGEDTTALASGSVVDESDSQPRQEVLSDKAIIVPRSARTNENTDPVEKLSAAPSNPPFRKASDHASSYHRHATRHIALLFVYQGWHYSGLAIQQMATPLPTVEGELLKALEKTHLIEPGTGWDGCEFSRCGRTDRGVSSAGQVVSLWIKSKRTIGDGGHPICPEGDWRPPRNPISPLSGTEESHGPPLTDANGPSPAESIAMRIAGDYTSRVLTEEELQKLSARQKSKLLKTKAMKHIELPGSASEYSYPHILNRVLPPEIRVLAWSPLPQEQGLSIQDPDDGSTRHIFDARFSCTTRHYRYFFTRQPIPDHPPLDIPRMQAAAARLVGEHDFRNFCKVDGSKQIENHCRRVLKAVVRPDSGQSLAEYEQLDSDSQSNQNFYVFELVGSAFLWHQVRHIMSVLFHVGHGFEDPEIVTRLLHTGYPCDDSATDCDAQAKFSCSTEQGLAAPVKSKPLYQMGAALPLQLYRCGYDIGAVDWRYGGYDGPVDKVSLDDQTKAKASEGHVSVLAALKSQAEEARLKARQIEAFYEEAVRINRPDGLSKERQTVLETEATSFTLGGGEIQAGRKYVKFLDRPRGDSVEEQNRRWKEGKGESRRLRKLADSPLKDVHELSRGVGNPSQSSQQVEKSSANT
jgi:tRNA pseudouridine38/39 synthase